MKMKKIISIIALMLVACMMLAMLASCAKENETTAETKKETVNETEKETVKETEKETVKETEKETVKETEKETVKETEPETERETKNVTYTTVIDNFKSEEWQLVFDPDDNNKTSANKNPQYYQNVFINDAGEMRALNRTVFEANYTGEAMDLSEGFILTVTADWKNSDPTWNQLCTTYYGNSSYIQIGNCVIQIREAFMEYYNGAAPVIFKVYSNAMFKDDAIDIDIDAVHATVRSLDDGSENPMCDAELYTEAWGHHYEISEDVNYYLNTTYIIKYDGYALTMAVANGDEVLTEWELWDGSTSDEIVIDPSNFTSASVRLYKGWGGYHESGDGHAYFSNFSLQKAVPVEE